MFSLHEHVCHNFHMLLIKRFNIEILIMLLYVLNDTLCMKLLHVKRKCQNSSWTL